MGIRGRLGMLLQVWAASVINLLQYCGSKVAKVMPSAVQSPLGGPDVPHGGPL
jgi:hypothetical protein